MNDGGASENQQGHHPSCSPIGQTQQIIPEPDEPGLGPDPNAGPSDLPHH